MKRIILIGAGNIAHHLGLSLFGAGHQIIQVISKTQNRAKRLAEKLNVEFETDITKIRNRINELYIILEGMNSRMELMDNKIQKLAGRLGL